MKKLYYSLFLFTIIFFFGCIKDSFKGTTTYTYYVPVYKPTAEVLANMKSNAPRQLENPGKLYIRGQYIFLNEINRGIHVIDNADPSHPQNIAFVDIPGNVDIAVRGNALYADFFNSLVTLDISNPLNIILKKITQNIFPEQYTADTTKVIVDWIKRDTTMPVSGNLRPWWHKNDNVVFFANSQGGPATSAGAPAGIGGSMARFTIANNYLYSVDRHTLRTLSLNNPFEPTVVSSINAGWDIETIYPLKNKLFLGSMGGVFIFDISNPASPASVSNFTHARACDPVIADDNYAYITLRKGTNCGPAEDELLVVNITNLLSPTLQKTYPMFNPHGLSKDGPFLFICDGTAGLKVYNASDVNNLQLEKTIGGMETYDVIAWNGVAIVVAKDGLYQYDYSNTANISLLSKINIVK